MIDGATIIIIGGALMSGAGVKLALIPRRPSVSIQLVASLYATPIVNEMPSDWREMLDRLDQTT